MTTISLPTERWDIASVIAGTAPPIFRTFERLGIFEVFEERISLPEVRAAAAPEPQIEANYLIRWSGLSRRSLSELIGVTHPTFGALIDGSGTHLTKKPEARERLSRLYELSTRIVPASGRDPYVVARVLGTVVGGRSIAQMAADGEIGEAYLAALRTVAPRKPGLLRESLARRDEGSATVALSD